MCFEIFINSPIAFDKPEKLAYVAFFALRFAYNHYAIAHAYNAVNAHAQGSDRAR